MTRSTSNLFTFNCTVGFHFSLFLNRSPPALALYVPPCGCCFGLSGVRKHSVPSILRFAAKAAAVKWIPRRNLTVFDKKKYKTC